METSHTNIKTIFLSFLSSARRRQQRVTASEINRELTNRCQMMSNRKCVYSMDREGGKKSQFARSHTLCGNIIVDILI